MQPEERDMAYLWDMLDAAQYGEMPDSTDLIREDREC